MTSSEDILEDLHPPGQITTLGEVKALLNDPAVHTLCLRSTFEFVKRALYDIKEKNIPGEIFVAGVWRGGLSAYVAGLVQELSLEKKIFLADTFSGFLPVHPSHKKDQEMFKFFDGLDPVQNTPASVRKLFEKYRLPVENVVFLEGDIAKTSREAYGPLCLLIVDVDFYEPTYAALSNLHKQVQPGGYVYVDDYGVKEFNCKEAVDDLRKEYSINRELKAVNEYGVYWQI